jgi:hypothetical protein
VIAPTDTPRHNERVAVRVIENKALVIVIDEQRLYRLSRVGTRIWELCDGRSVAAIAATLVKQFHVDSETALKDVCEFVEKLHDLGALVLENAR